MVSPVLRIAIRDLRGSLPKFKVFLVCLFLGVLAISLVGTFNESVKAGLQTESAEILGGDISLTLAYRRASKDELLGIGKISEEFTELISFRTMISNLNDDKETSHALAKANGIDKKYPLYGKLIIEPPIPLVDALGERNGVHGMIAEPILFEQLNIKIGSFVKLGDAIFQLRGRIVNLPGFGSNTFSLGPKIFVYTSSLKDTGLLKQGTLFETDYFVKTNKKEKLDYLQTSFSQKFSDRGFRWRDRRNPAPGIETFIDRLAFFLTVLGMAGLVIGGVGVSTSVGSYMNLKRSTIATLKTLGASSSNLTTIYLAQILILSLTGTITGALTGSLIFYYLKPLLINIMPIPLSFAIYPKPMINALTLGLLVSIIFSLIPLLHACRAKASELYRPPGTFKQSAILNKRELFYVCFLITLLISLIVYISPDTILALWFVAGTIFSFFVLHVISVLIQKISKGLISSGKFNKFLPLKLAFASISSENGENKSVLVSIGIGLIVLATIGQIEKNLETSLTKDLPAKAPAYFLIDIQSTQREKLINLLRDAKLVSDIKTAPMLRGFITKINDKKISELDLDHWSLRGDRGITYETVPTTAQTVTSGEWWPAEYKGSPQISFAKEEGEELGLSLGDTLTVNILGRDLTGTISSFRDVNFATMGINFLMVFNPNALSTAPHTHIASVYAPKESEGKIIKKITKNFPNITSVSVRDTINKIQETITKISLAIKWSALVIIFIGFVVILGALASNEQNRAFEASLLKTLGARKTLVLYSFGLRSAIIGSAAAFVSLVISTIMSWLIISYFLSSNYTFDFLSSLWILLIGMFIAIVTSLLFSVRPLVSKPARILRTED